MPLKNKTKYIINWCAFLTVASLLMVKLSFLPAILSYSTKLASACLSFWGSQYLSLITVLNCSLPASKLFYTNLSCGPSSMKPTVLFPLYPVILIWLLWPSLFISFASLIGFFWADHLEEPPHSSVSCSGRSVWASISFSFPSAICLLVIYSTNTILARIYMWKTCRAASAVQTRLLIFQAKK